MTRRLPVKRKVVSRRGAVPALPVFATGVFVLGMLLCVPLNAEEDVQRRLETVNKASAKSMQRIATLEDALDDENPIVRRAALRGVARVKEMSKGILLGALKNNDDVIVRRSALTLLVGTPSAESVEYLSIAASDEDATVRKKAIKLLASVDQRTDEVVDLLEEASEDEDQEIRRIASRALSPFDVRPVERVPFRERSEVADHVEKIDVVYEKKLPAEEWKFRKDLEVIGHAEGWYEPDYDDSGWKEAEIEEPWEKGYVGPGWYRRSFELPERPDHASAELIFSGVDESAWVWINGVYVGGQDIGPEGWNEPFRVVVTDELEWNDTNVITVRVKNTRDAGGIWKPIRLEALNL